MHGYRRVQVKNEPVQCVNMATILNSMISQGHCAPGYEPVRQLFEQHLREGIEDRCQCCIYVKGEKILDIHGTSPHTPKEDLPFEYTGSSLQNVFSSSKVLTSLVIAMLEDRGHLKYDQKVSDLWPEYGQHGKENTTVSQVMRHEAGLSRFDKSLKAIDLTPERIRQGAVSDIIASQVPEHPPGEQRVYHSITRGWIANEIVRRADPKGRTIGQFLVEEVALPLGLKNELNIGTPLHLHQNNIAPLKDFPTWWAWGQLVRPRFLGGGAYPVSSNFLRFAVIVGLPVWRFLRRSGLLKWFVPVVTAWMNIYQKIFSSSSAKKTSIKTSIKRSLFALHPVELPDFPNAKAMLWVTKSFNTRAMRCAEVPSANGHCSARALAKVAASIVGGGCLGSGEHRLLSSEGCARALGNQTTKKMWNVWNTYFSNAGWNTFKESKKKGRHAFVGWMGLGGSVCQWHPETEMGFGYAMNMLEISPGNDRGRVLQELAVKCARQLAVKKKSNLGVSPSSRV